ncbi:MAG: enoyl-CoA hydratase-related protein [Burkholderiaceae bacterium]|nr:enoyl-CoA hydratase-related protein [Burkholderiaceae bacterium]
MSETLLVDIRQGVGLITLNRPDRLNAIDADMGEMLEHVMVRLALDDAVRVIAITGAGRGFCAGADLARLGELSVPAAPGAPSRRLATRPGEPQPVLDALPDSEPAFRTRYLSPMAVAKPVIAIVNGPCAGIGLALMAACDLRFASDTAVFATVFPRRGLVAEGGLSWTLPALIGHGAATDMLMSGRKVDAQEALRMGLVNAVHPGDELMPKAMAYVQDLADNTSPRSLRIIKRQLMAARWQTPLQATQMSYDQTMESLQSEDFHESLAALKEKRPVRFTGR